MNQRIKPWALLALPLMLFGCGQEAVTTLPQLTIRRPFQVRDQVPRYDATNVPKSTREIIVSFTEPVDPDTTNFQYVLEETTGSSTVDITSQIEAVIPYPQQNGLIFRLKQLSGGDYLKFNASYTLTLYPGIKSTRGEFLAFLWKGRFHSGPSATLGFGEQIVEGTPKVVEINRILHCGCLTVYARFNESLARSPQFYIKLDTRGLFAWAFSGAEGIVPTYPVLTNNTTIWGVNMGCTPANQAWDRVVKVEVMDDTVFDLEGDQMSSTPAQAEPRSAEFKNKLFYTCDSSTFFPGAY